MQGFELELIVSGVSLLIAGWGWFAFKKKPEKNRPKASPTTPPPEAPSPSATDSKNAESVPSPQPITETGAPSPPEKKLEDRAQAPATEPPPSADRKSYKTLEDALSKTKASFWGRVSAKFSGTPVISNREIEDLEEILYTSDLGPKTVDVLISKLSTKITENKDSNISFLQQSLKEELELIFTDIDPKQKDLRFEGLPSVWMVVGVNGAGKTTTIGKLAGQQVAQGKKVLIAACDTFRAAADAQLKVWANRAEVEIFSPENVKDPSAVAFDALQKAKAKKFDLVIIDTAGRLHTQKNLMEELKKIKRVMNKALEGSPCETLLVLDANSGQNALMQTAQFHEAVGITGVILTKMDGSAKGGVAVGIACEHKLPIKMIGVGEKIEDLRPFEPQEFVDSII